MKYVILSLIFMMAASQVWADSGNGGPGGGNVLRSKVSEVKEAIEQSSVHFNWLVREINAELRPDNAIRIRSPKLKNILSKIAVLEEFKQLAAPVNGMTHEIFTLVPELNGPCFFEGKPKDSSVSRDKNGVAAICLSVPRLQKYPVQSLKEQIAALELHEFSHLAGASEDIATNVVQPFAIYLMENPCSVEAYLDNRKVGFESRLVIFLRESNVNLRRDFNSDSERLIAFDEQFPNGSGEVSVKSYIHASQTDVKLEQDSSLIKFDYHNIDGSWSKGSLIFETLKKEYVSPTAYNFKAVGVAGADFIWEGKQVVVKDIYVSQSCFR